MTIVSEAGTKFGLAGVVVLCSAYNASCAPLKIPEDFQVLYLILFTTKTVGNIPLFEEVPEIESIVDEGKVYLKYLHHFL